MIEKTVKIYIGAHRAPVVVDLAQYDDNWEFHFQIFYEDQRWTIPSDSTIIFTGKKPDGHVFAYQGTLTSNEAVVQGRTQMTACAGPVAAEVRILKSGKSVATSRLILSVKPSPEGLDDIASDSALTAYAEVFDQLDALVEDVQQYPEKWGAPLIASTAADMTDQTRVYVYTGSETGYTNGNWYYWDGTAWTSGGVYNSAGFVTDKTLSVANGIADAEAVGEVRNAFERESAGKPLYFRNGYYVIGSAGSTVNIDNAPSASSSYVTAVGACIPGDILYIHAAGASSARAYGFLNASKQVLSRSLSNAELFGWEIVVPDDAAYVVVNSKKTVGGDPLDYCAYIGTPTALEIERIKDAQTFTHAQKLAILKIIDAVSFADVDRGIAARSALQSSIGFSRIDTSGAWTTGKNINSGSGQIANFRYCSCTIADEWYYPAAEGDVFWYDGGLYDDNNNPFSVVLHQYNENKEWKRSSYMIAVSGSSRKAIPVRVQPDCRYVRFNFNYVSNVGAMTQDLIDANFDASKED